MPKRKGTREQQLREDIAAAERLENFHQAKLARIRKINYHWLEDECLKTIHFYIGRRNYLIRELTKLQLGDFDG